MSKKKKRHSGSASGGRAKGNVLPDERRSSTKRFVPAARNLLFLDLVILAGAMFLEGQGIITELTSGVITLVSLGLLLVALWFQFGRRDEDDPSRPPRLK